MRKRLRKTKISFHAQLSQKIFPVLRKLRKKIAQNLAKLIAFHAQKERKSSQKKICAKIAKNLRKRFSHFVETLAVHDSAQDSQSKKRKKPWHIFIYYS